MRCADIYNLICFISELIEKQLNWDSLSSTKCQKTTIVVKYFIDQSYFLYNKQVGLAQQQKVLCPLSLDSCCTDILYTDANGSVWHKNGYLSWPIVNILYGDWLLWFAAQIYTTQGPTRHSEIITVNLCFALWWTLVLD